MMIDGHFNFADQQAISGTSDTVSTNVYDAGSAKKLFGGANRKARLAIQVTAAGGTSPTFQAKLVGADNAALTTNPVVIADTGITGTIAAADLPLLFELVPGLQTEDKRYYGVIFDQGGTSPTATVNAQISMEPHSALLR